MGEANGTRLSCARCEYARLFCGANGPTIRKPVSPLVYARLTSGYASRDFYKSETPKTTGGLYRVPSKVFALLVNKSSTNEVNMDCRSAGKFTVARAREEGQVVIAVEERDMLLGHVQLYEYKYY